MITLAHGVEHSHRTVILYHTQPSVTPLFLQLQTPNIHSPDRLLFYLNHNCVSMNLHCLALIFIYPELQNSGLRHIT